MARETVQSPKNLSRREMLRASVQIPLLTGALSMIGETESLQGETREQLKPIILIWLYGGMSKFESFDPKPTAPTEIRGEWSVTQSRSGILLGEHLPKLSGISDKFTIVRSVQDSAEFHDARRALGTESQPTLGLQHTNTGFRYVVFDPSNYTDFVPGHSTELADLSIKWNYKNHRYRKPNFKSSVASDRFNDLSNLVRDFERASPATGISSDFSHRDLAIELLSGNRRDIAQGLQVPEKDLHEYLPDSTVSEHEHAKAHAYLMAERLTKRGVMFCLINHHYWDQHYSIHRRLKPELDTLDHLLSTLIKRNPDTVIGVLDEFNRTPRINDEGGRDHWNQTNSTLITGASGAFGSTDRTGFEIKSNPVTLQKVRNTILAKAGHRFGVNEIIQEIV